MIDGQSLFTEKQAHHGTGKESIKGGQCTRTCFTQLSTPPVDWCDIARVTIDMLPDVALLEIFYFYLNDRYHERQEFKNGTEVWHTLVHVCRTWRNIVFGSPRRLNLRLCSTVSTPVRVTLDIWPLLPIVIYVFIGGGLDELDGEWDGSNDYDGPDDWGEENIIAALEHNDRICEIEFYEFPRTQSEKLLQAMQQPFPALTRLELEFLHQTAVQPDSFLGGSAPCLQKLRLHCIPFPGLPKLLLSATLLVHLEVSEISHSGYFSPEAMVTALSVLTSLESLAIGFKSARFYPSNRRPPLHTRTFLPILTKLHFSGASGYLEDLVARIDVPLLDKLTITLFHQLIFDTAQLMRFISRTPKFNGHDKAHVDFAHWDVSITLPQTFERRLRLRISCSESDMQLSSLARVCSSSIPLALIHTVEHLYIKSSLSVSPWRQVFVQSGEWLDFLRPFYAVKCLYICWQFVPHIAATLQGLVGERVAETLPSLQTLFLEDESLSKPVREVLGQFVAARQLAGHPIAISGWDNKHSSSHSSFDIWDSHGITVLS
jgi:hypothetical protein